MLLSPAAHAACTDGEEEDVYTTVCTPFLVPNLPSPFTSIPGNPDLPAIDGIPCTGRDAGQCIGLARLRRGSRAGGHPSFDDQRQPLTQNSQTTWRTGADFSQLS